MRRGRSTVRCVTGAWVLGLALLTGALVGAAPAAARVVAGGGAQAAAPAVSVQEVSRLDTGMGVDTWSASVVSANGATAVFQALPQPSTRQVYARLLGPQRTVRVSATSGGAPADGGQLTAGPAVSADGSTVFFGWTGAGNLNPSAAGDSFSKVFIKDLATRRLSWVTVPPVPTAGGMRRPAVGVVAVSGNGRLLTVEAVTDNLDVYEVVRYDRATGQWSTLCQSSVRGCGLYLNSPDGRYLVIDGAIHDTATGTVTPAPVQTWLGYSSLPCQFSGDSAVLVCVVRDIVHHLDVAHLTWYQLPGLAVTRRATTMSYTRLGGVDRDGSHLALSMDRYQPSHVMLHPEAYSYDAATGTATSAAITPDGMPSLLDSAADAMTDTGQVLFTSRDQSLDPPDRSRYFSDYLATIGPASPERPSACSSPACGSSPRPDGDGRVSRRRVLD